MQLSVTLTDPVGGYHGVQLNSASFYHTEFSGVMFYCTNILCDIHALNPTQTCLCNFVPGNLVLFSGTYELRLTISDNTNYVDLNATYLTSLGYQSYVNVTADIPPSINGVTFTPQSKKK